MIGRLRRLAFAVVAVLLTSAICADEPHKRALLIGINDYSATRLRGTKKSSPPDRSWSNLDGSVNDVRMMREILVARFGFADADILTLTDQSATRAAITNAIQSQLIQRSRKGDIAFFYYSGHGSQVRNSASAEDDKLDESFVPADSRNDEQDLRDKELRDFFNRILDRGARLTVVFDACHSGSGARGLNGGLKQRSVNPDLRDVADPSVAPSPEDRGALILSATQDFDQAYETIDSEGRIRGAFSWALARAIRDSQPGEPASDTFIRAQAHLRAEMPAQVPVLAGNVEARLSPFLSLNTRRGANPHTPSVAIEKALPDGSYLLVGGWVNGLTVGSRLRVSGSAPVELEVTSLIGASRAAARLTTAVRSALPSGALLEIVEWAAPPSTKLRIWIPTAPDLEVATAVNLRRILKAPGVRWIDDPTETTPTHLLRWRQQAWERVAFGSIVKSKSALSDPFPRDSTVFIQLPATIALASEFDDVEGVELVDGPQTAEYILAGRVRNREAEYAWIRPRALGRDRESSAMPARSEWVAANQSTTALVLRNDLRRIRRVHAWHDLPSPPPEHLSHYTAEIRDAETHELVTNGPLIAPKTYQVVLRLRSPVPLDPLYPRYYYVFMIDSYGKGVLLFPKRERGSVENRLPQTRVASQPLAEPPGEIPLGSPATFFVTEPYGLDAYFVLSTDEALSSTDSLEWDGVRSARAAPQSALEQLLSESLHGGRGGEPIRMPPTWSIEKIIVESMAPRRNRQ